MANTEEDPGASTQQFRAYVEGERTAAGTGKRSPAPLIVVGAVALVVVVVALALAVR